MAPEPNAGGFVVVAVEPNRLPEEVLAGAPNIFVGGVPLPLVLPPVGAPKLKDIFTLEGVLNIRGTFRREYQISPSVMRRIQQQDCRRKNLDSRKRRARL